MENKGLLSKNDCTVLYCPTVNLLCIKSPSIPFNSPDIINFYIENTDKPASLRVQYASIH